MNFRRIPFHFKATDPAERQSELMKRFGVPSDEKMYVETANTPVADAVSNSSCSPRLQHRLPFFRNNVGQPVKVTHEPENCASSIDTGKQKPHVRVIPIKVESSSSDGNEPKQSYSGPSVWNSNSARSFDETEHCEINSPAYKPVMYKTSTSNNVGNSKVFNIPIAVERKNNVVNQKANLTKAKCSPVKKHSDVSNTNHAQGINGSCVSKSSNGPCLLKASRSHPKETKSCLPPGNNIVASLNQISNVLKEFQAYKSGVEQFAGELGDKQYRYLDEMLTRCMINLDDVETFGNEEIRKTRKAAIRQVQDSINILEGKVQSKDEVLEENIDSAIPNTDSNIGNTNNSAEVAEIKVTDDKALDTCVASSEMKELNSKDVEVKSLVGRDSETFESAVGAASEDIEMQCEDSVGKVSEDIEMKDESGISNESTNKVVDAEIKEEGSSEIKNSCPTGIEGGSFDVLCSQTVEHGTVPEVFYCSSGSSSSQVNCDGETYGDTKASLTEAKEIQNNESHVNYHSQTKL